MHYLEIVGIPVGTSVGAEMRALQDVEIRLPQQQVYGRSDEEGGRKGKNNQF